MDSLPNLTPGEPPTPAPRRRPRGWLTAGLLPAIVGGAVAFGVSRLDRDEGTTRTVTVAADGKRPATTTERAPAPAQKANPSGEALSVQGVVKATSSGVVLVEHTRGLGTGFLIDTAGHILTNAHVVDRATTVDVTYEDGTTAKAKVLAADEAIDLAVLDAGTPPSSAKVLDMGDSSALEVGEPVVAIGNPLGFEHTATAGIVSAVKRQICSPNEQTISNAIQTDAAINQGNSGGPLLNHRAQVIGINSQIVSQGGGNEGIGFAVPIDTIRPVAEGVIAGGRPQHAWIGVLGEPLTPPLAKQLGTSATSGVVLRSIDGRGPAKKAGLVGSPATQDEPPKGGDIVVEIDGDAIRDFGDLSQAVSSRKVGEKIVVTVLRDGKRLDATLTLQDRPSDLGGGCRQ